MQKKNCESVFNKIKELGLRRSLERAAQKITHFVYRKIGLSVRLNTADRVMLDEVILPFFTSNQDVRRVLFVGCDYYTAHYPAMFYNAECWTIEPRPSKAKYGGNPHIIALIQDIDSYAESETFDLIICNGVYGWGLDRKQDLEQAFAACFVCLKFGGFLLLGWNNVPERTPVPLESLESLNAFAHWNFPGLGGWRIPTGSETGHVFDFYRKLETVSSRP